VFGALLVVLGCTLVGIRNRLESQKRLQAEKDIQAFLIMLCRRLSFQVETLPVLLHSMKKETHVPAKDFLLCICDELSTGANCPMAWERAIRLYENRYGGPCQAFEIVASVGRRLGTTDVGGETERLTQATQTLAELIKGEGENLEKKQKTTVSLAFLTGISLALLCL